MKNIFLIFIVLFSLNLQAQFSITVNNTENKQESYLYGYLGSKEILLSKSDKNSFKVTQPYWGFMKIYFPNDNQSISLISENKDIELAYEWKNEKISNIQFFDDANKLMSNQLDAQKKLEIIYPVLLEMQGFYKNNSDFGKAIQNEIHFLENAQNSDLSKFSFIKYYFENYQKFLVSQADKKEPTKEDYISFFNKSNNFLETSTLLKPILINYIKNSKPQTIDADVDSLINTVGLESPRGQTILSELIEIFSAFGLETQKSKYLGIAKNLKCTINERLSSTLQKEKNTEIGSKAPNLTFNHTSNTQYSNLYHIKSDKKILMFWASTCTHCEKEMPEIIRHYSRLKNENIEVIGFSLDHDKDSYYNAVKNLPWINSSDLKGWNSSYAELYNIFATPTFFVLDKDNKIIAKPNSFGETLNFLNIK